MADGFGFRTPSGNIYCNGSLDGGAILNCVIENRNDGSAPPAVGNCPAGRKLLVDLSETGPAQAQCGGATGGMSTYTDVADYGVSASFGRIDCTSQSTGFTCRNAEGRGFTLSRGQQQLF